MGDRNEIRRKETQEKEEKECNPAIAGPKNQRGR